MNLSRLANAVRSALPFIFLVTSTTAVHAATYKHNVSKRVLGFTELVSWSAFDSNAKVDCGSSCQYTGASTGGIEIPDKHPTLRPKVWPQKLQAVQSLPPLVTASEPTVDAPPEYYFSDNFLLAEAARPFSSTEITAHTFGSGRVESITSQYIQLDDTGQTARAQFLEFRMPLSLLTDNFAYTLVPGSNGGTYVYYYQDAAYARYTLDVVVNGLVVWSQEETFDYIQALSSGAFTGFYSEWGSTALDGDRIILFLGRLPEEASWDISLVIRAEVMADADKCGKVYGVTAGLNPGESMIHCYELTQKANGLVLGRSSSQIVSVYAKDI